MIFILIYGTVKSLDKHHVNKSFGGPSIILKSSKTKMLENFGSTLFSWHGWDKGDGGAFPIVILWQFYILPKSCFVFAGGREEEW